MGDVSIDDNVAIASGVILQADANCRLIIHAGVCIGMGAILHAHHGNLEIQTGVVLGAGVLIIGKAKIGNNACIGSTTTIWNTDVAPERIIPPGSIVGNSGREITKTVETTNKETSYTAPTQQLPQSTFVPPSPLISSTFVPPAISPTPVSLNSISPTPPPLVKTTFVPPSPVSPIVPPLVVSTFIDPNPSSQSPSTFVPLDSHLTSSNSPAIDSSETSQEITQENDQETSKESKTEEPHNNNHQFYGQNRINQLLGTLMPQNKPSS